MENDAGGYLNENRQLDDRRPEPRGDSWSRPPRLTGPVRNLRDYFQPDSLSQAARARGLDFSHSVMDLVSLLSIFSFMQTQYLRMISPLAPPVLSLMHWL